MISNSGGDERGGIYGGYAGDQTGNEWNIISWYSRPWTCVLRHPDPKVRETIASLAEAAANNNNIGYDQWQRTTYWQQLQKAKYNPAKITVACESDCSAGVTANTKATGYILGIEKLKALPETLYTGNMRANFRNAGFTVLTDSKYLTSDAYLLRGDILLNDSCHTATNLTNGSKAGVVTPTTDPDTVTPSKTVKWKGTTTEDYAPRSWAGTKYSPLKTLPKLSRGSTVEVCDTVKDSSKANWYYVRMNGKTYGFLPAKIVKKIEEKITPKNDNTAPSKTPKWKGKVINCDWLNVRSWAGTEYNRLKSVPQIKAGTVVEVCDSIKAKNGGIWYYVRINGKTFGFVHSYYIKKV